MTSSYVEQYGGIPSSQGKLLWHHYLRWPYSQRDQIGRFLFLFGQFYLFFRQLLLKRYQTLILILGYIWNGVSFCYLGHYGLNMEDFMHKQSCCTAHSLTVHFSMHQRSFSLSSSQYVWVHETKFKSHPVPPFCPKVGFVLQQEIDQGVILSGGQLFSHRCSIPGTVKATI